MTPTDLRAALTELGMTRAEFATIVKRDWRQVQRWCSEELDPRTGKPTPVPDYVELYVERLRSNTNPAAG